MEIFPIRHNSVNASIIGLNDGFLCLSKNWDFDNFLFRVDASFNIAEEPRIISKFDDPTFLTTELAFANALQIGPHHYCSKRNLYFRTKNPSPEYIYYYYERKYEKNWSPFYCREKIYLVYSICPFQVLFLNVNNAEIIDDSPTHFWAGFDLRGGTRAIPYNEDEYLCPCHHVKVFEHNAVKQLRYYHIGAFTFSRKLPFRIRRITEIPLLEEVNGPARDSPWLVPESRILFERGIEIKGEDIYISCGEQDFRSKVMKLSRNELENSLVDYDKVREWQFK